MSGVPGVSGFAMFVASNDEFQSGYGGMVGRDNVFAVDLTTFRTVRLTRDQLGHGVAVAGGRSFVSTARDEGSELCELAAGDVDVVAELGPTKANEVVAVGDRLIWTDADDRPIESISFDTPRLRAWTVGTADATTLFTGKKTLRGPSFGPHGDLAVVEMPRTSARAPQCSLLLLSAEGEVRERVSLRGLGRRWFPDGTVWASDDRVVIVGAEGANADDAVDALAVIDVSTGEVVDARAYCSAFTMSPDRSQLLLYQRAHHDCHLSVVENLNLDQARMLGRFPLFNPRSGVWLEELPLAVDLDAGIPPDREVVDTGGRPHRLRRMIVIPVLPPASGPRRPATGISLAPGAEDRLNDYGGHLYVQILDADDPTAAARALERARPDLRTLDTPPEWEGEGLDALPNQVGAIEQSAAGPWTAIDANDTDNVLLRRIPAILRRHLEAEGVRRAVISFPDAPATTPVKD